MSRAENKTERLLQMEALLLANPQGLTQSEIARRLGVDRSVIHRNLYDFQKIYPTITHDDGRVSLDRAAYLVKVAFTLHEATAVHLAARLLATRMDRQNPHAASALRKLGVALEKLAPRISAHVKQSADVMDDATQWQDPRYLDVLEKLTLAWAELRKVKVWHRSDKAGRVFEYTLSPYFIEPYAVGQTTHLIARDESTGKMRTLKIERIEKAEVTQVHYEIPNDFDPRHLLADAWGIWYTTGEPVEVILKFHRNVASRLEETRWHRSEKETKLEDGSILWEAKVAEPQEMIPWIRSWGADCEVLEPKGLREALTREARDLAEVYEVMEMNKKLFAHFREKDKDHKEPQYLWEHLTEASELAKGFASKIGLSKSGQILGLLHDLGKASEAFQNYLLSSEGILNPDSDDHYVDHAALKGKIDHSTAGAQIIYNRLWNKGGEERIVAQVLSLAIASHHSGLIDCLSPNGEDNFTRRMEKAEASSHVREAFSNLTKNERAVIEELLADDSLVKELIEKFKGVKEKNETSPETISFKYGLLIRYLFSCLLDADRINTADFEFPGNARLRNNNIYPSWGSLIERLNSKIEEFENKPNRNEVDEIRSRVSQSCLEFSSKPKGVYQLTVPTGGGKTFASLRFALNHAKKHSMDRVFHVIPYTSIIDQNAEETRKVLEDKDKNGNYLNKVVLEHHSNLTPDEETRRQNLLAENWDAPIVFTTQVQFLEALFGSGTRGARRMHQLANSVIIFDEIQTIPIRTVHMFNLAIRFLVQSCGATVVLCTATQPLLDKVEPIQRALNIKQEQKIIPYEKELFQQLKRVEVFDRRKVGGWSDKETTELALSELHEKDSVLIVVNTKKCAYSLYQAIVQEREITPYHLSTNMCPAHRLDMLNEIKKKLENKEPVICVSTQLIEAGVDIDFGAVIRHLAGMDSIAQAAGRCNRNGVREGGGNIWVVNPAEENLDKLKDIKIGKEKAQTILDDFNDDPVSFGNDRIGLNAMESYYKHYFYERQGEMNYPVKADSSIGRADDLFTVLSTNESSIKANHRVAKDATVISFKQSFQSAAKAFRVIDSMTQGVIVPYGEGNEIITELCGVGEVEKQYKLIKKAQRFSVNLFPHEFRKLADSNAIREVQKGAGIFYLDKQYYSEKFGWSDNPVNGMEDLIV